MAENTIDITKFYTRNNEENGIYKELILEGKKSGIEACVYGVNSNKISVSNETYKKEMMEINKIKDDQLRSEKSEIAFAKRMTGFVKDFRNKETQISFGKNGKEMTDDEKFEVMFNSPIIARAVLDIASETELFLDSKKNA